MQIKKAIITAAGKTQRTLPLQSLVDRDASSKTALQILIEEILQSGIDEVCVVIAPGDEGPYRAAAGPHAKRVVFVEQPQPLGYGHAVHCASEFTGRQPFLLLVGDHLYVARGETRCAQQLVEIATAENCSVSAVQATHESKLPYYGAVGGRLLTGRHGLYEISEVIEKPTPTDAEQRLVVPGLRAGHYLCFFGMHVLGPAIFSLLQEQQQAAPGAPLDLSAALHTLASRRRYLAFTVAGQRYDIGAPYGLLFAQLALSLEGRNRHRVLTQLIELLAVRAERS